MPLTQHLLQLTVSASLWSRASEWLVSDITSLIAATCVCMCVCVCVCVRAREHAGDLAGLRRGGVTKNELIHMHEHIQHRETHSLTHSLSLSLSLSLSHTHTHTNTHTQ